MGKKKGKKKLLIALVAVVLVCAMGAGIFFAAKGGGEPVNVYSFQFLGMTEYWGDSQESYGPVTTDKIQTVFLSETQKVTELKVQPGDSVKKGDVLMTFDTTLDSLSLERKRLDVEKIKVQIQAAAEELEKTYELVPYFPPDPELFEEEDLGRELKKTLYEISTDVFYDGSKPEKALICWMQEDAPLTEEMLQALWETAVKFQTENAEKAEKEEQKKTDKKSSSASDIPEVPSGEQLTQEEQTAVTEEGNPQTVTEEMPDPEQKTEETQTNPETTEESKDPEDGKQEEEEEDPAPPLPVSKTVPVYLICDGETVWTDDLEVGKDGALVSDACTHEGKTWWFCAARRVSDGAALESLAIPAYPQTAQEQARWEELWAAGVEAEYIRSVLFTGQILADGALAPMEPGGTVQLEAGKDALLLLTSQLENAPKGSTCTFEVTPADGILRPAESGTVLTLAGTPEELTELPLAYTVKALHTFQDNQGQQRAVAEEFHFSLEVVEKAVEKQGEFYVVLKVTEENKELAPSKVWQGVKVLVHEDGFQLSLFDGSALPDHILPPPEEEELDIPQIDPNNIYTAEQIVQMQKDLTQTLHEQKTKLKMAEAEYNIMERELGDGNVYAEIDGEVITVLTEDEAKTTQQPIVKVSGGGGFFVEGTVSELEKDNLKIGQEVTINDWNTGSTYTGEVRSIGDFPSTDDGWNGLGNPNASYYPFMVFVDGSADLQEGRYISMTYSTSTAEHGVYLESPFILTEQGTSYVYVRGADGRLEKRPVTVGKSLWGTYKEILSGITEEDFLAFPYGKEVKEGAQTVESDISALYEY